MILVNMDYMTSGDYSTFVGNDSYKGVNVNAYNIASYVTTLARPKLDYIHWFLQHIHRRSKQ